MDSNSWQAVVARKKATLSPIPESWKIKAELLSQLNSDMTDSVLEAPGNCNVLSTEEVRITEAYTATELLKMMSAQELSSKDVTTAFCKRAAVAHQLVNCLTENFFDRAIERAEYLDSYLAKTGRVVGPLHGLPISLKDCFKIIGVPSTIGFVSFIKDGPSTENSALVNVLLDLGAVLYVKTNLPQTIMTADTHNNIFGRTLNPYNRSLTAGGSSGGEGALVAMKGSLIGIGTDIAGSIRIPALCCGVYGFKPTLDRVPYAGQTNPARNGLAGIACAAGPLAIYAEDIGTFLQAICDTDAWRFDETAISASWRNVQSPSSLRIGVILEDDRYPLHPPILRVISEAVETLKATGHTLLELTDFPSISDINTRSFHFFGMDPAGTPFRHISASGEPPVPSIAKSLLPESERLIPTLESLYDLNTSRASDKAQFRRIMVENELDVIIMPANAGPASKHDQYGLPPYTVYINYLDHPACVLPCGFATHRLDSAYWRDVDYVPDYDAHSVEGAPCSIQVVGRPMKDEELLVAVKLVSKILQEASNQRR